MEKGEKYYRFSIKYMIGDADGYTKEKTTISGDNPFIIQVAEALDKLQIPTNCWGIALEESSYKFNLEQNHITKYEYDLLSLITYYEDQESIESFCKEYNLEDLDKVDEWLQEFDGVFREENEYTFLVYQSNKVKVRYA